MCAHRQRRSKSCVCLHFLQWSLLFLPCLMLFVYQPNTPPATKPPYCYKYKNFVYTINQKVYSHYIDRHSFFTRVFWFSSFVSFIWEKVWVSPPQTFLFVSTKTVSENPKIQRYCNYPYSTIDLALNTSSTYCVLHGNPLEILFLILFYVTFI